MSKELKTMQDISDLRYKLNNTLKVSFDFDSTLSTEKMQTLCKKYLQMGADVYVTTSRGQEILGKTLNNSDLFEVTDVLGIKKENVIFTQYQDKYNFVKDFDIHFDDDFEEIYLINQHPGKCLGFLYEEYQPSANGIIEY